VLTAAAHLAQAALLALFLVLRRRRSLVVLGGLAAVAFAAHLEFFTTGHLHVHEFFHYYINSKYFAELGYTGLYDATVIADHEDDPAAFDLPDIGVRSLATYEVGPRRAVLERADAIRSAFTPGRWAEFKADIAWFRQTDGILWRMGDSLRDHGYNGSPLLTAILGGLARQPFLATPDFIGVARWLDVALVLLGTALLARVAGAEAGLLFLFFWAANPFNDHAYIGGAYLRYLSLISMLAAVVAWRLGRFVVAGAAIAIAILLRGFPALLLAGLVAQNLLSRDRRALLRRHAPLFAAAAVTGLVLIGATSFERTPDGSNPWAAFAHKMSLHGGKISPNVVTLRYLFFYSEDHNARAITEATRQGRKVDWVAEAEKTFAGHRAGYLAALAVTAVALVVLLRRGRPEDGLFAGLVVLFAWFHLAHYYYAMLALVPFLYPRDRDGTTPLALLCLAAAAVMALVRGTENIDLRFLLLSGLLAIYFAVVVARRIADPATAPALARARR
jgi:hypothetical protein